MKKILLFLISILVYNTTFSQVFDVETIKNEGENSKRINLVILGDGYTVGELSQFETDADNFITAMFSQTPFAEYSNYFNAHIINVISNESGANHPGTAVDEASYNVPVSTVDNYFGSTYDGFGSHRLLYAPNSALVMSVLADNFPEYDQAIILVNAPYYGGSGGEFPVASTGDDADEIAIHEMGHSLVNLKDEYYPGDALAEESINMTQETDPALVRWKNWLNLNGIGIYQYCATGSCASWYRPHQTCKMRYLGFTFCAVCKEGIIEKIHDLVSPIDTYSPSNATIENPTFPLQFDLTLINPSTNSLESAWTLNSTSFSTNLESVSLLETDLNEGLNTLSVVVTDNSALQLIDNHDTFHMEIISWTIDYATLGITDISSIVNKIEISMFPNPVDDILSVKVENNQYENITLKITSLDGKKVQENTLSNSVINLIELNQLTSGMYVISFYSDSEFLISKKIIKK